MVCEPPSATREEIMSRPKCGTLLSIGDLVCRLDSFPPNDEASTADSPRQYPIKESDLKKPEAAISND
jgi:hypothetical protein